MPYDRYSSFFPYINSLRLRFQLLLVNNRRVSLVDACEEVRVNSMVRHSQPLERLNCSSRALGRIDPACLFGDQKCTLNDVSCKDGI